MDSLNVVCWRWGTRYGVEYINRLHYMLARNLKLPHTLYCITDDPAGLDAGIQVVPMPEPNGLGRARRLWLYTDDAQRRFGPRILSMDIDCVITGDITPLVDRPEPLVAWRNVPEIKFGASGYEENGEGGIGAYNASMILMSAGVFPNIFAEYLMNPKAMEDKAKQAGCWLVLRHVKDGEVTTRTVDPGDDDQAIASLYMRVINPPIWTERDGVFKYGRRGFERGEDLPDNARIVFFNGSLNCNLKAMETCPWVAEHWR